jgi:hypothetical protein
MATLGRVLLVVCLASPIAGQAYSAMGPRVIRTIGGALLFSGFVEWPMDVFAQGSPPQQQAETAIHEHVEVAAPTLTPTRDSSGTAWLPVATPMYGLHGPWRGWDLRVAGVAYAHLLYEPVDRHRTGGAGTRQIGSVNWGMVMMRRALGEGRFGVRAMLSAEPLTVPGCGSLSLLATGEICRGDTIHDRQPPHDLLMELAVDYERRLLGSWRWQVYAGLAGEPALGPPGYPHRPSAMDNPIAPMTHHWTDATHATFGVVTAALHNRRWKAEASLFNGRESDESRVDVDFGALDSVAARLSFLPTERLAFQVSAARLHEGTTALFGQPRNAVTRATTSVTYHRPLGTGIWATTAAYGINETREFIAGAPFDITTAGAFLESSITIAERHTMFARLESVGMPAHHLHAHEYGASVFSTGKVQAGYVRHMTSRRGIVPGVGTTAGFSILPRALAPHYSGRVAPSFSVFFTIRAARHEM